MAETGKVGDDLEQRHLSHPSISSDGWLHGQNNDGLGRSWCRRRQHDRWARGHGHASSLPRHDGRPDGRVNLGGLPQGNSCRLDPPLEGILCGGQPTGVARCGTGCRSRHRLKGLPGGQTGRTLPPFAERKRQSRIRTRGEGAKTEVSSDTYPLQTKANRACGEAPRASVPAGAAEVRQRGGLPRRHHNGPRINLLYSQHGRLLLGDRQVGLTPRSHLNYLGHGVKYPLGLSPLLGPGP